MKRFASTFVAILFVSFIALDTCADAKEQWTRVQSENFTLIGNASEREIREVAIRLEQYRSILARLFDGMQIPKTVPTTVIVFKNDKAFKPFRPLYQGKATDVAGYFQPGRELNYIAVSAESKGERNFGTIFHEFVHLFVDSNLRGLPLCFNEGLAEYLSSVKISDDGARITLGDVSPHRVRLLSLKKLLPLETLLTTNYDSDYYNEGDQRSAFYVQSWSLAHYLIHLSEGNGLERFTRFLGILSRGASIDSGLSEVFGLKASQIEASLSVYAKNPPNPTRVIEIDQTSTPSRAMQSSPISYPEARANLGDLLLHLNRLDEAEPYLQESLALEPDLVAAQTSLGMLRVKQDRVREGVQILRSAAARDLMNPITQYYFAYALSREGMTIGESVHGYSSSAANEMRSALDRVIELSPNFIEAYRLHAFVDLVRNEQLDKAEVLLQQALVLSPGRQDLMLHLAQIHLRAMNFRAARRDLEPILQHAADARLREQATTLFADIRFAEEQASRPETVTRRDDIEVSEATSQAGSLLQQAHAVRPRLRRRFKGERVRGLLTKIDCLEKGVELFVIVGQQTLRLHAPELRSVFFVAYVTGLERTVTCGARNSKILVVLTYHPSSRPPGKYDGEAVAIEFVPDDIEIEP